MSGFFPKSFDSLPDNWKSYIFGLLENPNDLANCSRVCKNWQSLSNKPELWNRFGVKSAEDFIKLIQHNHKTAQVLHKKKINHDHLSIYFLGLPDEESYINNSIPSSLYYFKHGGALTIYLQTLEINGYRLAPWYSPSNNQDIFKEVFQKQDNHLDPRPHPSGVIVLAYIKNPSELLKYNELVKPIQSNVLMLFITTDTTLSETISNAILWKAKDDFVEFYSKVTEKIDQLANPWPEKIVEKRFSTFYQCQIV